jgi:hypothetical protein
MKSLLSAIIIFVFVFASFAFAETRVNVDLEKLDPQSRNAVLEAQKRAAETSATVSKENLNLFKEYGKSIAETFAEVCKTLNIEVNKFAETPVGKLTMWLIVYKVVGKDILHVILMLGMWFLVTGCCVIYAYIFHMPKKIVTRDDKKVITKIEYIQKFKWNDMSARAVSAFLCGGFWAVTTAVTYFKI